MQTYTSVAADVTDEWALRVAADEAGRNLGYSGLDVLILNATYVSDVTALSSLKDYEHGAQPVMDDMQNSLEVNVFGVLTTVFAFLPLVKAGGLKKVVAISSGMADVDFINETQLANAVPYAASKAALNTVFAKFNAAYGATDGEDGILFMSLCPGYVDTDEVGKSYSDDDLARLAQIGAKFKAYAPAFTQQQPSAAARAVLTAIGRSSLAGGSGGSFLSHNGSRRWM